MSNTLIKRSFWQGKSVVVTGHTGFKGSWLTICLERLGAKVIGIALEALDDPSLFESSNISDICTSIICDIRDHKKLNDILEKYNPEIIFHLAAQPLVREGYKNPIKTYSTNLMGSINLLDISRTIPNLKSLVIVTTDKVYKNKEWCHPYRENDEIGGFDPYSASKAALEIAVASYRDSFFNNKNLSITTARAGNVIGGGDWAEDRLIPDLIRAWNNNEELIIRHPNFIRPWQHVLEPLYGYLLLAQNSYGNSELNGAYNFGPKTDKFITVKRLLEIASEFKINPSIKYIEESDYHESKSLVLDYSLSMQRLGYSPRWTIRKSIKNTIKWYEDFYLGKSTMDSCLDDIKEFFGENE